MIAIETLRISPSAFLLAKNCTQSIELFDFDGTKLLVEPGTSIQLPVFAIHHDKRFYDEPNVFKPERFEAMPPSELRKNGQFLPFGDGPRICLGDWEKPQLFVSCNKTNTKKNMMTIHFSPFSGQKFAILQIKLAIVEVIRHYFVTVNSKTIEPIKASSLDSLLTPISEIYLDFQRNEQLNNWRNRDLRQNWIKTRWKIWKIWIIVAVFVVSGKLNKFHNSRWNNILEFLIIYPIINSALLKHELWF